MNGDTAATPGTLTPIASTLAVAADDGKAAIIAAERTLRLRVQALTMAQQFAKGAEPLETTLDRAAAFLKFLNAP